VIALSPEAEHRVDRPIEYYEEKGRLQASVNLLRSLELAKERIAAAPAAGLEAPRPYHSLKRAGRRWIVEGRYWIAYTTTSPPVISGVFHITSDIPNRI
jgi:plasmid stabilization system protein ParE